MVQLFSELQIRNLQGSRDGEGAKGKVRRGGGAAFRHAIVKSRGLFMGFRTREDKTQQDEMGDLCSQWQRLSVFSPLKSICLSVCPSRFNYIN